MSKPEKNFVERYLEQGAALQSWLEQWTEKVNTLFSDYGENDPRKAAAKLQDYKIHKTGSSLFSAFNALLIADKPLRDKRLAELNDVFAQGDMADPAAFVQACIERTRLQILTELEPFISDLAKFCSNPGPTDDQLVNLRSALRISKGHTPSDAQKRRKREYAAFLWIEEYNAMARTRSLRSRNDMARAIMEKAGVSRTTALACAPSESSIWVQAIKRLIRRPATPNEESAETQTVQPAPRRQKRPDFKFGKQGVQR